MPSSHPVSMDARKSAPGSLRPLIGCLLLLFDLVKAQTSLDEATTTGYHNVTSSELSFQFGNLKRVPVESLCNQQQQLQWDSTSVNLLSLADNEIDTIAAGDFRCLAAALRILNLRNNRIEWIADEAFEPLAVLQVLQLEHNLLKSVPAALRPLKALRHLNLGHNLIRRLEPSDAHQAAGATLLSLDLRANPLEELPADAFDRLGKLKTLTLSQQSGPFQLAKPLEGLAELRFLHLDRANLSRLPQDLCRHSGRLATLVLKSNQLEQVPQLGQRCQSLLLLDLSYNRLAGSLAGHPFKPLANLLDLYLGHNQLEWVAQDAFLGLRSLQVLELDNNRLLGFHPSAFLPLQASLLHLDVAHNRRLERLDGLGLERLQSLRAQGNQQLRHLARLPAARRLWLTYAYHCCDYLAPSSTEIEAGSSPLARLLRWLTPATAMSDNHEKVTKSDSDQISATNLSELILWPPQQPPPQRPHTPTRRLLKRRPYRPPPPEEEEETMIDEAAARQQVEQIRLAHGLHWGFASHRRLHRRHRSGHPHHRSLGEDLSQERDLEQTSCLPQPGPFLPCRDLFEGWWLRLGVWCVFLAGFAGNILVIVVLSSVRQSSSSSALTSIMWLAHSRRHIDVPRFLVINLAIADLLMSLYLGLLALVDLSTWGEFKLWAIKWQHSRGCKLAGFLGVLSSELSVFILAIITLERNYAITNAVHLNRRLSLQKAMLVMLLGYLLALSLALLPLQGQVSDYRKYSICLPLDVDARQWASRAYIGSLIGLNATSLLLLLACYLRMYCAIRGSQAWNANDLRIAKRMSILVLTDFLCWLPIILVACLSLAGHQLVGQEGIKVLTIFVLPLNSLANPFLYAITTKKFKRDLDTLWHRLASFVQLGTRCGNQEAADVKKNAVRERPYGARYNHYQHNLLAGQKRKLATTNQQQQRLNTAAAATCSCRRQQNTKVNLLIPGQQPRPSDGKPDVVRRSPSSRSLLSNGATSKQVHLFQEVAKFKRPRSATHIVVTANSACQTTGPPSPDLCGNDAAAAPRRYLTVDHHHQHHLYSPTQQQHQQPGARSASACGDRKAALEERQWHREPARACGSYDTVRGQQKPTATTTTNSRLGLNWLLFGPLAKAWSSIQISLANSSAHVSQVNLQTAAQINQKSCEAKGNSKTPDQLTATLDQILMLASPPLGRCQNERRMSRSLDLVAAGQQVALLEGNGEDSPSSSTQPPTSTLTTTNDDDDQRLMLVTINRIAAKERGGSGRRRHQLGLTGGLKEARRARCTRCRSWSPALLTKLEQCITQIKSKIPGFGQGFEAMDQESSRPNDDFYFSEMGQSDQSATSYGDLATNNQETRSHDSSDDEQHGDNHNNNGDGNDLNNHNKETTSENQDQDEDSEDKFNERAPLGWTGSNRLSRHGKTKPIRRQSRHKLQQQWSANSDTMSTRTAGTLLTNMSVSFDSNTNVDIPSLTSVTTITSQQLQPQQQQQQQQEQQSEAELDDEAVVDKESKRQK